MEIKFHNMGYTTKPFKAHENDAGYDVFARVDTYIPAHTVIKVPLGFGVDVPAGCMANVYPRSGKSLQGLLPQLPPIDCGYTGEVHAIVLNTNFFDVTVKANDKIGQLVFVPIMHFNLVEDIVDNRGDGAFGSTDRVQ